MSDVGEQRREAATAREVGDTKEFLTQILEASRAGASEGIQSIQRNSTAAEDGSDSSGVLRWAGEIAGASSALLLSKIVDPEIIASGLYLAVQSGRAVHGYIQNPLLPHSSSGIPSKSKFYPDGTEEKIISTSEGRRIQIIRPGTNGTNSTISSEPYNDNDRRMRIVGTTAKSIGTVMFSAWIAIGTPIGSNSNPDTSAPEVSTEQAGEENNTATPDTLPASSVCAPAFDTPIPYNDVDQLDAEAREQYKNGVEAWQDFLAALNLYPKDAIDGIAGPLTQTATLELKSLISAWASGKGVNLGLDLDNASITASEMNILLESGAWSKLVEICNNNLSQ